MLELKRSNTKAFQKKKPRNKDLPNNPDEKKRSQFDKKLQENEDIYSAN